MYRVWLRWVARPEFARAECLSCQSQPSLFRAKESPLNIELIGKGKTSVIISFALKDQNMYSALLLGSNILLYMAYLLCSHVYMLLMIFSSFIWKPCCLSFPKCKNMCRLSHLQNAILLFVNLRLVWMPSMMISIFLITCNS